MLLSIPAKVAVRLKNKNGARLKDLKNLQLGQKTSVCRGSVKKGIIAIDISNVKNKSKALKQGNRKMSSEHVRNL